MSNEIKWRAATTGSTLYFTIRTSPGGLYWNQAATANFETIVVANWTASNYCVSMTETVSGSYLYNGTFPAISGNMVAGWYWVDIFLQAGGSPAISDTVLVSELGYWNGTQFSHVEADLLTIKTQTVNCAATVTIYPAVGAAHELTVDTSGRIDVGSWLGTAVVPMNTAGGLAVIGDIKDWINRYEIILTGLTALNGTYIYDSIATMAGGTTVTFKSGTNLLSYAYNASTGVATGWSAANSDFSVWLTTSTANIFSGSGRTWTYSAGGTGSLTLTALLAIGATNAAGDDVANATTQALQATAASLATDTTDILAAIAGVPAAPTPAEVATAIFQDTTAGDFTTAHSFGSMVANIGSGTVQFTANALANAPTGASAADVWDYLTTSITTSGSIGVALVAGLAKLTASRTVSVSSPVADNKDISITRGDSYDATTAQIIEFNDSGSWPIMTDSGGVQLSNAEVKCVIGTTNSDFDLTCVVTGVSPNQVITVTATGAETEAIPATPTVQAGIPPTLWTQNVRVSMNAPTNTELRLLITGSATVTTPLPVVW